jgi:hypothetical protein
MGAAGAARGRAAMAVGGVAAAVGGTEGLILRLEKLADGSFAETLVEKASFGPLQSAWPASFSSVHDRHFPAK